MNGEPKGASAERRMGDADTIVDVAGFAERLNALQRSLLEAFLIGGPKFRKGRHVESVITCLLLLQVERIKLWALHPPGHRDVTSDHDPV